MTRVEGRPERFPGHDAIDQRIVDDFCAVTDLGDSDQDRPHGETEEPLIPLEPVRMVGPVLRECDRC